MILRLRVQIVAITCEGNQALQIDDNLLSALLLEFLLFFFERAAFYFETVSVASMILQEALVCAQIVAMTSMSCEGGQAQPLQIDENMKSAFSEVYSRYLER